MKRLATLGLIVGIAFAICLAPGVSYAQERGLGEVARYSFSGKLSTSSTRTGPYSLPAHSRLSFYNGSNLGGKTLYVKPFTSSGAAFSGAVSMNYSGEKSVCGSGSSKVSLYPHLWLSYGTQMVSGQYIIRTV